mmetsp:Transcript_63977/g.183896  ORF Transcript_63977/g.183896 Transcript_63977/m.183896 type:complete len:437 (-) Transcript_63977:69-1379(-)
MFRASQIFGRQAGSGSDAAGYGSDGGGAWASYGGGGKGSGKVDWNDAQARDQYRAQVAASRGGSGDWNSWEGDWESWGGGTDLWSTRHAGGGKDYWGAAGASGGSQWSGSQWSGKGVGRSLVKPPTATSMRRSAPSSPSASASAAFAPAVATATTVCIQGNGLASKGEAEIEQAARQVAIENSFSVHEVVKVVSPHLAHINFPHREASAQFIKVTNGSLRVGGQTFSVRHPQGMKQEKVAPAHADTAEELDPSETLLVRNVADVTESQVFAAFSQVAPRIKGVKCPKNFSGQSKGIAFVHFHEAHEAAAAMRHFRAQGIKIGGRTVYVDFAPPQSMEEEITRDQQKQKADEAIQQSHQQALSGVNGDMWASYLAMFSSGAGAAGDDAATTVTKTEAEDVEVEQPSAKRPRSGDYDAWGSSDWGSGDWHGSGYGGWS